MSDNTPLLGGCEVFCRDTGIDEPMCCDSCHEDEEMGYFDLPEVWYERGTGYYVACCRVGIMWEHMGSPPPTPTTP